MASIPNGDLNPELYLRPRTKVTLRRVRLNAQGYDSSAAYWGVDKPLWYFSFHDQFSNLEHSDHIRASDRASAKYVIRQRFPSRDMRFYN